MEFVATQYFKEQIQLSNFLLLLFLGSKRVKFWKRKLVLPSIFFTTDIMALKASLHQKEGKVSCSICGLRFETEGSLWYFIFKSHIDYSTSKGKLIDVIKSKYYFICNSRSRVMIEVMCLLLFSGKMGEIHNFWSMSSLISVQRFCIIIIFKFLNYRFLIVKLDMPFSFWFQTIYILFTLWTWN